MSTTPLWLRGMVLVYCLIGFALLVLPREWFPAFYRTGFMAGTAFVCAAIIALPARLYRTPDPRRRRAASIAAATIAVAVSTNALGGLGLYQLYKLNIPYDKYLHYILPFIFTLSIAYYIHVRFDRTVRTSLALSCALLYVGIFLWELEEYLQDIIFKTDSWGLYGQQEWYDTTFDVLLGIVGIIAAASTVAIQRNVFTLRYKKPPMRVAS